MPSYKIQLAVFSLRIPISETNLYFSRHAKYVGGITKQVSDHRAMLVYTDLNILAAINPKSGELLWRRKFLQVSTNSSKKMPLYVCSSVIFQSGTLSTSLLFFEWIVFFAAAGGEKE